MIGHTPIGAYLPIPETAPHIRDPAPTPESINIAVSSIAATVFDQRCPMQQRDLRRTANTTSDPTTIGHTSSLPHSRAINIAVPGGHRHSLRPAVPEATATSSRPRRAPATASDPTTIDRAP